MKTLETVVEAFLAEAHLKGQISAYEEAMGRWSQCEADSGRLTIRCTTETALHELRDETQETLDGLQKVLYPEED